MKESKLLIVMSTVSILFSILYANIYTALVIIPIILTAIKSGIMVQQIESDPKFKSRYEYEVRNCIKKHEDIYNKWWWMILGFITNYGFIVTLFYIGYVLFSPLLGILNK